MSERSDFVPDLRPSAEFLAVARNRIALELALRFAPELASGRLKFDLKKRGSQDQQSNAWKCAVLSFRYADSILFAAGERTPEGGSDDGSPPSPF